MWKMTFNFEKNSTGNRVYLILNGEPKNNFYLKQQRDGKYIAHVKDNVKETTSKDEAMKYILKTFLEQKSDELVRIGQTSLAYRSHRIEN